MKKTLLSTALSGIAVLAAGAIVSNAPSLIESRLNLQSDAEDVVAAKAPTDVLKSLTSKKVLNEKELRRLAEVSKVFQLDSIITSMAQGTQPYTGQFFNYDDRQLPEKRINAFWDAASGSWDTSDTYDYVWDEDGYCLMMSVYNERSGQRYEYEYNDRKLGIVQILSDYVDGEWIRSQRGDYTYDDAGNIVKEVISTWDAATSEWTPAVMNTAAWDNLNRQTEYASYQWNGTEWVGNGEKKTFAYLGDKTNVYTSNGWYIWDETTKDWVWFMKRDFDWRPDGQISRNADYYFNKNTGEWDGCYEWYNRVMYNKQTTYTYDNKDRLIKDVYAEAHEIGVWTDMSGIDRLWEDFDDGTSQETVNSYVYRNNREPWDENLVLQDSTINRYNAAGLNTHTEEWHIRGVAGPLQRYQMKDSEYDEKGNLISEYNYGVNRYNTDEWMGVGASHIKYNSNSNIIEKISQRWADGEWIDSNKVTYQFENGFQTEELSYRWDGSEWTPSWGNGFFYDFTVKVDEIVLWPGADFQYKLNETRSYNGSGDEWDYTASVYHYSDIEPEQDGIAAVEANGVSISYNGGIVTVKGEGEILTRVFDATGRAVAATAERTVDLSEYPAGLYIVKANGVSRKIMK